MIEQKEDDALRYEISDANPRALVRFALVLAVAIALAASLAWVTLGVFKTAEDRGDPPPPPLARRAPGRLPPEPRLQTAPIPELERYLAGERRHLGSYGWVDRGAGVVHIPIEEAMRLAIASGALRGAPPPTAAPGEASAPPPRPSPPRSGH
jgi:hypothetical protein